MFMSCSPQSVLVTRPGPGLQPTCWCWGVGVSEKGEAGGEKMRGVARVGGGEMGWLGLETPLPRELLLPLITL